MNLDNNKNDNSNTTISEPSIYMHDLINKVGNIIKSSNKNDFMNWIITVHNQIRLDNGKKTRSIEDVIEYYKNIYNPDTSQHSIKPILFVIIIVLFIVYKKEILKFLATNKFFKLNIF